MSVLVVDFRTQPDPAGSYLDRYNRFWDDEETALQQDEVPTTTATKAFAADFSGWGDYPDQGIPYCIAALHPLRPDTFFTMPLPAPGLRVGTMPSTARAPACNVTTKWPRS